MSAFEVVPTTVSSAGGSLVANGARLESLADALRAAAGAGPACGDPAAQAAYGRMHQTWLEELMLLGEFVATVGDGATSAAELYQSVDQSAMPVPGPRPLP